MSDRHELAHELANKLALYERLLDQAFAAGCSILAALPEARLEANLALGADGGAIDHLGAAVEQIRSARRHTLEGHRSLAAVQRKLGLPAVSIGDKLPAPAALAEERAEPVRLRVA